jgi:hypothetical protein
MLCTALLLKFWEKNAVAFTELELRGISDVTQERL